MSCCDTLLSDLAWISSEADSYTAPAAPDYPMWPPLDEYVVFFEGLDSVFPKFLAVPDTASDVPNLEAMLQALGTPLNIGFGRWSFYNVDEAGKTVLTLPQAPTKARIDINGVRVSSPRDYAIVGTTLTLAYPLAIGDLLTLYSYGA